MIDANVYDLPCFISCAHTQIGSTGPCLPGYDYNRVMTCSERSTTPTSFNMIQDPPHRDPDVSFGRPLVRTNPNHILHLSDDYALTPDFRTASLEVGLDPILYSAHSLCRSGRRYMHALGLPAETIQAANKNEIYYFWQQRHVWCSNNKATRSPKISHNRFRS